MSIARFVALEREQLVWLGQLVRMPSSAPRPAGRANGRMPAATRLHRGGARALDGRPGRWRAFTRGLGITSRSSPDLVRAILPRFPSEAGVRVTLFRGAACASVPHPTSYRPMVRAGDGGVVRVERGMMSTEHCSIGAGQGPGLPRSDSSSARTGATSSGTSGPHRPGHGQGMLSCAMPRAYTRHGLHAKKARISLRGFGKFASARPGPG
jgi:hypothetical protein